VVALPGFDDWVEFAFDEVVSEGGSPNFGTGTGGLERIVFISPDTAVARVRWRRDRIAVRPRDGWRPNTVYRVELAPGLEDLRSNPTLEPAVITFTTGAPIPARTLNGRAVDWLRRQFVAKALVEAILLPDSLAYVTAADSAGRFSLGPLPDGEYLVRITVDANNNRRQDLRDPWDTVRVGIGRDSVGEVWAFLRDTMPPRLEQNGITRSDSFSIVLRLNQPIDPSLRLGDSAITVKLLPDSTEMQTYTALPKAAHDSIYVPIDSARRAQARAAADTAPRPEAPPADTAAEAAAPPRGPPAGGGRPAPTDTTRPDVPLEPRPRLDNTVVIRVGRPLIAGARYLVELRGVRTAGGAIADTLRGQLQVPEPPKPAVADSSVTADSAASVADSAVANVTSDPATVPAFRSRRQ
jgi:hypothetical protein